MTCNRWYRLLRTTRELLPDPASTFVRNRWLQPHADRCPECRRSLDRMDRLNGVLRGALLGHSGPLGPFETGHAPAGWNSGTLTFAGAGIALAAFTAVSLTTGHIRERSASQQSAVSGQQSAGLTTGHGRERTAARQSAVSSQQSAGLTTGHIRERSAGRSIPPLSASPQRGASRDRTGSSPFQRDPSPIGQDDRDYLDGRDLALATWWLTGSLREAKARGWENQRLPRYRDDFVRPEPALLADAGGTGTAVSDALKQQQREAAVVDARLFKKVTLKLKAVPLDAVCEELSHQTGVEFTASREVRDENATLFLDNRPAREVMRGLVRLFGYYWSRTGEEKHYRYELISDLRSRISEQEMRERDADAALAALDDTMSSYRPYLGQSPDQLRARVGQADGAERQRLGFAADNWAYLNAYQALSPSDRLSLANGNQVLFIRGASNPLRSMPDSWYQTIRSAVDGQVSAGAGGAGAQPYLSLTMDRSEMGQISLHLGYGGAVDNGPNGTPTWGGVVSGSPLATGVGPSVAHPDNAGINRSLAHDPALSQTISWEAIPSCPRFAPGAKKRREADPQARFSAVSQMRHGSETPHVSSGDVWEAIHRATGLDIIADAYSRFYPAAQFKMTDVTAFQALCRAGDDLGVRWRKDGGFLLARSTSFFWNKLKEVPERTLARWKQDRSANDGLPLSDLLEMADLSDEQLHSGISGQVIEHCWGIEEWGILGSGWFRMGVASSEFLPYARALATLDAAQLQRAQSAQGLVFESLNPRQQDVFAKAYLKKGWHDAHNLAGLRFRFDYIPAGAFFWHPAATGEAADATGKQPLIMGKTREEALTAAASVSPTVQAGDILRSEGGFSLTLDQANGEHSNISNLGERD